VIGRMPLGAQKLTSSSGARAARNSNHAKSVFATQYLTPAV
jgi:hypothetical protein